MAVTEEELYKYHENVFKPIYADLVAVTGEKHEQVSFELEAALSHIAVAHTHDDYYKGNIEKAHGHLQRASLDAVKILWLEYRKRASKIISNRDLRKFAANTTEKALLEKYQQAERRAREARSNELNNTGRDPSIAVEEYYEAANLFGEVVELIDPDKVSALSRFQSRYATKEILISFLIGCISSALVAVILA